MGTIVGWESRSDVRDKKYTSIKTWQEYRQGFKCVPLKDFTSSGAPLPFLRYVRSYASSQVLSVVNRAGWSNDVFPESGTSSAYKVYNIVQANYVHPDGLVSGEYASAAYARAHAKLYETLFGDQAEWGVSILEGHEAIHMISQRANQLLKVFKSLRSVKDKRTFKRAQEQIRRVASAIGKEVSGAGWKDGKPVFSPFKKRAENWLEYWMGWAPLVGDIQTGCKILTEPDLIKPVHIKAGASVKWNDPGTAGATSSYLSNGEGKVTVHLQGKFFVDNPNRFLAARLGLLNWAEMGYQVIPGSFLLDWFVNTRDVLRGMAFDASGVSTSFVNVSVKSKWTGTQSRRYTVWGKQNTAELQSVFMHFTRGTGARLRMPTLQAKLPARLSTTRAATLISLITLVLADGHFGQTKRL